MSDDDDDTALELRKLASLVTTARRLLGAGQRVELSVLEARVRALCDTVGALDAEEARALVPGMQSLVAALDRLGEDLTAQFGRQSGAGGR